jgi:hypothetical protein
VQTSQSQATIPDYQLLVERIYALLAEEYDPDVGEVAPSAEKVGRANRLLYDAFRSVQGGFPRGFASSSGRGDIGIYWRAPGRDLHVTIPASPDQTPRAYMNLAGQGFFDERLTPALLAQRLSQFNRA